MVPEDDPAELLWTYTILITTAADDVGLVHDRMPMAITPDKWDQWLDPQLRGADEIKALMALRTDLDIYTVVDRGEHRERQRPAPAGAAPGILTARPRSAEADGQAKTDGKVSG